MLRSIHELVLQSKQSKTLAGDTPNSRHPFRSAQEQKQAAEDQTRLVQSPVFGSGSARCQFEIPDDEDDVEEHEAAIVSLNC